jgi:putative zinc finger protein
MCEKELLVAYLYDDLAGDDRATFEAHLRRCAECRDELKGLRAVRADLSAWAPPQPDFGFRVVRGGRAAEQEVIGKPAPSWRAWWTPAAGLAAAAVLVLAAASAVAHVEVHRGPDGVTVRTGWPEGGTSPSSPASGRSSGGTNLSPAPQDVRLSAAAPVDAAFLAEIERRLDALEASSRDSGLRNASTLSARSSDAEIVRRVRDLLTQSEIKQRGELALRISQVLHDVDLQRAADLARIQQGLGRIDATVIAEAAAHRDLTNLVLTSAKQK